MFGLKLQKRLEGEFGKRLAEGRAKASSAFLEGIRREDMRGLVTTLSQGEVEEFEVVV